ncbi:histidinol-phosphate transaminase [Crassaminicella profunda]|uniref:histidinol-phosphate transaminase n=1 Tax=Crassaminicella profunda TaxID=1286698 RepID=UPI001CA60A5A|nr:histidinol-phosphate transaminase [Crassaminicella profunda]QZY57238.1 histidinol-phosphate transaminase [Crassaminicella profunda]
MINFMKERVRFLKPYEISNEIIKTKLDANENPYNLFEILKDQFIENLKILELNRYPDTNSDELRECFASYLGLKKENILCGNGSDEVIQTIINTFVGEDEYVITHSPTFSMYKIFTTIAGGNFTQIPCEDDFKIDVDKIIKEANERSAKLIFLCNPNNPTGRVIPMDDIEKVLKETKSIVIVDEAYSEFLDESSINLIKKYDHLIVLRTLSKAFALAGARIGYGAASERMMDALYRVKAPYNLNVFSQMIGKIYMENIELIQEYIEKIKKERTYLYEELRNIKTIEVFPTGANFILIRSKKAEEIIKVCKEEKISIRAFNEELLKNCFRISVGSREENNELLRVFRKVV